MCSDINVCPLPEKFHYSSVRASLDVLDFRRLSDIEISRRSRTNEILRAHILVLYVELLLLSDKMLVLPRVKCKRT